MSRILEELDGAECNIDDVLVHAPTKSYTTKDWSKYWSGSP